MQLDRLTRNNFYYNATSIVTFSAPFLISLAIRHGATSVQTSFIAAAPFLGLLPSKFWGLLGGKSGSSTMDCISCCLGRLLLGFVPWLCAQIWWSVVVFIVLDNLLLPVGGQEIYFG